MYLVCTFFIFLFAGVPSVFRAQTMRSTVEDEAEVTMTTESVDELMKGKKHNYSVDVLNHDIAEYEPMKFDYYNNMYMPARPERTRCFEDYMHCLDALPSHTTPVCAYNKREGRTDNDIPSVTFPSYCEAYYDNCRTGMRFWRIIGFGRCLYTPRGKKDTDFTIEQSLRKSANFFKWLFGLRKEG